MVVRFHVVAPAARQRSFTVRLPVVLGRGDEATFRIQHDLISRRHCELVASDGQVRLRDLGSMNGTFLDGERLPANGEAVVPPGGTVRVGGLTFTVEYPPAAAAGGDVSGPADAAADAAAPDTVPDVNPVPVADDAAAPAAGDWPVPEPGPQADLSDDDQLNAFFKGLE